MEFTGERIVPGKIEADLFNEHLSRYYFAQGFADGRTVLDLGCGVGYGSSILAQSAFNVTAVDISVEALEYAREHYTSPNLGLVLSECCHLPFEARFDLVVCFELIEHLAEQGALLSEIRRVLKDDGLLLISTPNRVFYTEERHEINPYHTSEFDFLEFKNLLGQHFASVQIGFQNHVSSIFIGQDESSSHPIARIEPTNGNLQQGSNFFVALCSGREKAPELRTFVYLPQTSNLLREKDGWIQSLEGHVQELSQRILQLQKEYDDLDLELKARTEWALRLDKERLEWENRYQGLVKEFEERTNWAMSLSTELSQSSERLTALQREFDERTAWALRLDEELRLNLEKLRKIKESKLFQFSRTLRLVPKI